MSEYTRDDVETILPAVWDESRVLDGRDPHAADSDMPKVKADPSHGFSKVAMIADLQVAWKRSQLDLDVKRALFMVYGVDDTYRDAARVLGCSKSTVMDRCNRGVLTLLGYLNREPMFEGVTA